MYGAGDEGEISQEVIDEQFAIVLSRDYASLIGTRLVAVKLYEMCDQLVSTVEPPNKGQVGAWALVHYLGVVLYWGFFVKKSFLCVVRYNNDYYYKCTNQSWNSSSYN